MNGLPQNSNSQTFFGGIITQVITGTNDPAYQVGKVYSGYYQYASSVPDGTFHPDTLVNPSGNKSLTGIIYLPFAAGRGRFNSLPGTMNPSLLTVAGGVVTGFDWSFQMGDNYAYCGPGVFYARLMGQPGATVETTGTVSFSPPLSQN